MTAFAVALLLAGPAESPARWVRAEYRVQFSPQGLIGEAEFAAWPPRAGRLGLGPWSAAVLAGSSPIVHTPTGPEVELGTGGTARVRFSVRATPEPGAERFTLEVPAVPVAVLECEVPADRALDSPTALVQGSTPVAQGRKRWRAAVGGQSRVELVVRRPERPSDLPPTARLDLRTRYELALGVATVKATATLSPIRGTVGRLELRLDPRLTVQAVTAPQAITWSVENQTLRVQTDGSPLDRVAVACGATYSPSPDGWPLPALKRVGLLAGEESVEVVTGPDLAWQGLAPGGYRVADARTSPGPAGESLYTVKLTRDHALDRQDPVVRAVAAGATFATTEDVLWRLEGFRAEADVRVRVNVLRGPLGEFQVRLPTGFRVTSLDTNPEDPGLMAGPRGAGQYHLVPSRPLATGQALELTLRVAGPGPPPGGRFTPPDVVPEGATDRQGTLRVRARPGLALVPESVARPAAFRNRTPRLTATLVPRPGGFRTRREVQVRHADAGWRLDLVDRVRGDSALPEVWVRLPGGEWAVTVRAQDGTARPAGGELALARHLAALGLPWAAVAAVAPGPTLVVVAPHPDRAEVEVRLSRPLPDLTVARTVPLPDLGGEPSAPAVVRLPPDFAARWRLVPHARSLAVLPRAREPATGGWRLTAARRDLELTPGRLTATLSFRVVGRPAGAFQLPVELPPGAEIEEVRVNGLLVTHRSPGGVPLPTGDAPAVTVRYTLPAPAGRLAVTLPAIEEAVPGLTTVTTRLAPTEEFRRGWWLAPADGRAEVTLPVRLVARDGLTIVGLTLGLVALGVNLAWPGWGRGRLALLAVLGVGVTALPDGWRAVLGPVTGVMLAGFGYGLMATRRAGPVAVAAPRPSTTASVLRAAAVAVGVLLSSGASGNEPATVLQADYEFTVDDVTAGTLSGTGRFQVSAAEAGFVELPLGGARLKSATVGGKPAAVAAGAGGYRVALPQGGPHEVTVAFAVPIRAGGPDREARLTGPETPVVTVKFTVPAGVAGPDIPSRRGRQTVARGPPTRLEADHGSGPVQLRWRVGSPDGAAGPALAVTAVTAWDGGSAGTQGHLAAWVRVEGGRATGVTVPLPAGVEPGTPRLTDGDGRTTPLAPAVADARLMTRGESRRLQIEFREATSGRFGLVLPLAAEPPAPGEPRRFPAVTVESPVAGENYLVVRRTGPLAPPPRQRLIDYPAEEVARRFLPFDELALAERPVERAFQQLPGTKGAELTAAIAPDPPPPPPEVDLAWTLGTTADYEAGVTLVRPRPTGVEEFPWPDEFPVGDLRAAGLLHWERPPGKVRLWLSRPAREVSVRLAGSLTIADELARLPANPSEGGPVTVRTAPGWTLLGPPPSHGLVRVVRAAPAAPPPVPPKPPAQPGVAEPVVTPQTAATEPPAATLPPDSGPAWLGALWVAGFAAVWRGGSRLTRVERGLAVAGLGLVLLGEPLWALATLGLLAAAVARRSGAVLAAWRVSPNG